MLDRVDCDRCGGSGQVTKEACGQAGLVPCPDCDNIPEYAVPDEVPENPQERLDEIEQELEELAEKKDSWDGLRSAIADAKGTLDEAATDDVLPDDTQAKFDHISHQVGLVLHDVQVGQSIRYGRENLRRERRELQTYLDHLEGIDA